jgi:hypothetical protein
LLSHAEPPIDIGDALRDSGGNPLCLLELVYRVVWNRSPISSDRKRMVCEYEAADAETVRKVQREAAAEFDRVRVGDVVE